MNPKFNFVQILLIIVVLLSPMAVLGHKTVNTDQPMLPYVNFSTNDITYDGQHNESGFKQIIITTQYDTVITTYWRQNGNDLHIVLDANAFRWVALGWSTSKPAVTDGVSVLNNMNIILATNETVKQYTGTSSGLVLDKASNVEKSTVQIDQFGIYSEFLYSLKDNNTAGQILTPKTFNYFIFVVGESYTVNTTITDFGNIFYLPAVYVESSAKEGYQANNASFGSLGMVLLSFIVFSFAIKYKRKLK